ncbi:MAG: HPr family phosphocarrier protein [Clostridiales bacterium]|jgi:phosphocarrier protein|nr:HPr family phosphocarrier protein [Clostridiales bacterium]
MFSQEVEITVPVGLHARPAMYFVQKASEFRSSIWLDFDDRRVNAKSLLGVLSLGIEQGAKVQIIAEGQDEETSVIRLAGLIKSNFKEEL